MQFLDRVMTAGPDETTDEVHPPMPLPGAIALTLAPVVALVMLFAVPGTWSIIAALGTLALSLALSLPRTRGTRMRAVLGLLSLGYFAVIIAVAVLERHS